MVVSLKLAAKPPQKSEKAIQLIDIVGMATMDQPPAVSNRAVFSLIPC
jgi:hypothetical protein